MLKQTIIQILNQTWPMIVICLVIIVSLRLGYIIKNKVKIKLYKELITLKKKCQKIKNCELIVTNWKRIIIYLI